MTSSRSGARRSRVASVSGSSTSAAHAWPSRQTASSNWISCSCHELYGIYAFGDEQQRPSPSGRAAEYLVGPGGSNLRQTAPHHATRRAKTPSFHVATRIRFPPPVLLPKGGREDGQHRDDREKLFFHGVDRRLVASEGWPAVRVSHARQPVSLLLPRRDPGLPHW